MKLDIFKHELIPLHEVLPEDETKELLNKLNITKGQLPKILLSDPVIKKMKANPGDVVRITRKSRTAGSSIYFRVVVEG